MCALTYILKISAKVIFPVCSSYFLCLLLLIITRELQRNQMKTAILFQTGEVQTYSLHKQGQPNQKTSTQTLLSPPKI